MLALVAQDSVSKMGAREERMYWGSPLVRTHHFCFPSPSEPFLFFPTFSTKNTVECQCAAMPLIDVNWQLKLATIFSLPVQFCVCKLRLIDRLLRFNCETFVFSFSTLITFDIAPVSFIWNDGRHRNLHWLTLLNKTDAPFIDDLKWIQLTFVWVEK